MFDYEESDALHTLFSPAMIRKLAVGVMQGSSKLRDAANEDPGGGGFAGREKGMGSREMRHLASSCTLDMSVIAALCKPLVSPIFILLLSLLKPP